MELRHLRYFVALAEALHFGRAAASLHIAQPSLSYQIRQLEAELQSTLLLRTSRRVQLTEAGRLFLEEARETLAHADRAALVARRASRGEIGILRVAYAHWVDMASLLAALGSFSDRNPAIQLNVQAASVPLQIAALRDERLDVGFVRGPVSEPSLASEILMAEPFAVAMSASHPLATKGRLRLRALANEPFILMSRAVVPVFHDLVLKVCRDAGFVPRAPHEVDDPQVVLGLVAVGRAISLVPASAGKARRLAVVFRPLEPSPPILETLAAWRRDNTSPLVSGLLQVVRQTVALRTRR